VKQNVFNRFHTSMKIKYCSLLAIRYSQLFSWAYNKINMNKYTTKRLHVNKWKLCIWIDDI